MTTTNEATDLLTIEEAARLLKVSMVTIHRWLKQGRLPSYRVGPRAVRLRRADVMKMLVPASREGVNQMTELMPIKTELDVHPLSEDQISERLAALREAQALREQMLERRGGKPLAPSWPIIRAAREERSKRL